MRDVDSEQKQAAQEEQADCERPLVNYPVPLEGATARIMVPRDLTPSEAERIYRVLKSLCAK